MKLSYGTAGFRADASLLESTVFRVGILAALRSLKTGSVIGLMITASHNKVADNGIKVADPSGGMLTQDWEPFSDAIANAPDPHSLLQVSILSFFKHTYTMYANICEYIFVCQIFKKKWKRKSFHFYSTLVILFKWKECRLIG